MAMQLPRTFQELLACYAGGKEIGVQVGCCCPLLVLGVPGQLHRDLLVASGLWGSAASTPSRKCTQWAGHLVKPVALSPAMTVQDLDMQPPWLGNAAAVSSITSMMGLVQHS